MRMFSEKGGIVEVCSVCLRRNPSLFKLVNDGVCGCCEKWVDKLLLEHVFGLPMLTEVCVQCAVELKNIGFIH